MAIGKIDILDMRGAKVGIGIKSIITYYTISKSGMAPPELINVDLISGDEGILSFSDIDTTFKIDINGIVWGSKQGESLLLSINQDIISGAYIGDWKTNISELPEGWDKEEGWYLWVKTVQTLTDNSKVVSYAVYKQGEKGDQGLPGADAPGYYLETSQSEILMFKTKEKKEGVIEYTSSFSPENLYVSLYEKKTNLLEGQQQIILNEEDKDDIVLSLYNTTTGNFDNKIEATQNIQIENGSFKIDINEFLKNQVVETVLKISFIKKIEEKQINTSVYLTIRFGISSDMASLNVEANGIVGAIQNTKLKFSAEGLEIQNGGFEIVNNNNSKVLWADDNGNLTLKGRIEAAEGNFSGTLLAATGTFQGELHSPKIISPTGQIGGFIINKGTLESVYRTNDTSNIVLDGENGKIIASDIELGTGAYIKNYLKIGETVTIKNPEINENVFLEVKDLYDNSILSFNSQGLINIGNGENSIRINGADGTIKSRVYRDGETGWILSNEEAIFNNVTVRGEIKTAIFSQGEAQAVGGNLIVRPCGYIENIEEELYNDETTTVITFKNSMQVALGDFCKATLNGKEQWFKVSEIIDNTRIRLISQILYPNNLSKEFIGAVVISFGQNKEVGISINGSTDGSFTPKQAISVFEFNSRNYELLPKIILGKIPNNPDTYNFLSNTYGLYAENALLTGSLITQGADKNKISCGISTNVSQVEKILDLRVISYHNSSVTEDINYTTKIKVKSLDFIQVTNYEGKIIGINSLISEFPIRVYDLECEKPTFYFWLKDRTISAVAYQIDKIEEKEGIFYIIDLTTQEVLHGEESWIGYPISTTNKRNGVTFQYSDMFRNSPTGSIVLWAGARGTSPEEIQEANFIVDQYGNVIARSGYFEGSIISKSIIEASEIKTATLTGSGLAPALVIQDCTTGIDFRKEGRSVFYLGDNSLIANIKNINFNTNLKIDETGSMIVPNIYLKDLTSDKTLKLSKEKISVIDYDDLNLNNIVSSFELNFLNGFDFLINTQSAFKVTEKNIYANLNFQVNKEISYGDVGKYSPIENEEGKIIGYDLYIN